jgi:PRTRC genetic system ThiF family protein
VPLFSEEHFKHQPRPDSDILIGCVDTRKARAEIASVLAHTSVRYWLDMGNNAASGQYVLGQPLNRINRRKRDRLRTVAELYPEIVDAAYGEDPLPSCSAAAALERQEPFINQALATSALAMLSQLLRYGQIRYHGAFFSAKTGRMSPLPVDPERWALQRRLDLAQRRKSALRETRKASNAKSVTAA